VNILQGNPTRQSLIIWADGPYQIQVLTNNFISSPAGRLVAFDMFDRYQMGDWVNGTIKINPQAANVTVAETYIESVPGEH